VIIGIGGISNSGKSALARKISEHYAHLKVMVLCQDDFAFPTPDIPLIKDHTDWEIPASIDFDGFYNEILQAAKHNDIVIDEGLFVFYEERLNRLYDKTIYMSISRETFMKRKQKDLRWGKEPGWYIKHIWDNHHRYFEKIQERREAFQLSGENPVDYESVFGYLDSR
jgi:uridine kinase